MAEKKDKKMMGEMKDTQKRINVLKMLGGGAAAGVAEKVRPKTRRQKIEEEIEKGEGNDKTSARKKSTRYA